MLFRGLFRSPLVTSDSRGSERRASSAPSCETGTRARSASGPRRSGEPGEAYSVRAERLMQCRDPVTIGVSFVDDSVGGIGDTPPLGRISETRYRVAGIGEIRVEGDVMLVCRQNIVVAAAH